MRKKEAGDRGARETEEEWAAARIHQRECRAEGTGMEEAGGQQDGPRGMEEQRSAMALWVEAQIAPG